MNQSKNRFQFKLSAYTMSALSIQINKLGSIGIFWGDFLLIKLFFGAPVSKEKFFRAQKATSHLQGGLILSGGVISSLHQQTSNRTPLPVIK